MLSRAIPFLWPAVACALYTWGSPELRAVGIGMVLVPAATLLILAVRQDRRHPLARSCA